MLERRDIMTKLHGTKTEQNLINAFAGEPQARNRYSYFAKQAKEEGYEQISAIFLVTAENEKEHAKRFYEYLGNMRGHVDSEYPFELGTTEENLKSAVEGENEEAEILYSEAEKTAREEVLYRSPKRQRNKLDVQRMRIYLPLKMCTRKMSEL